VIEQPAHMTFHREDDWSQAAVYAPAEAVRESFLVVRCPDLSSFTRELASVHDRYRELCVRLGLNPERPVISRVYVSDLATMLDPFSRSGLAADLGGGALSVVEQRPLDGGSVALISYHLSESSGDRNREFRPSHLEASRLRMKGDAYTLLWGTGYAAPDHADAYTQTSAIFSGLADDLRDEGMTLLDNAVRTWVYVRDIDLNYAEMVRARREFFESEGLTADTRYIASTGIGGVTCGDSCIVGVDAFAVGGLAPEQIVRMEAPGHLAPTIDYGVTFERGTRLRFGDRSHLFISGTASIDTEGRIVHPDDPAAQTRRTVENLAALLDAQGAGLTDLGYVIAYARSVNDRDHISAVLADLLPDGLPVVFLEGTVCRPGWLIELEGRAIIPDDTAFPPFF
jgi:enamine deaminase RidA (YjgF/YER057c/UK114 family)